MTGLEPWSLAYLMVVCFLAAMIRGYSGFGFSALLVLTSTWVLPPAMAVPMILLLEIIASIQLLPSIWQHIHWPRLARLLVMSAIGIPIGVYSLAIVDESIISLVISIFILCISLLLLQGRSYAKYDSPTLDLSSGFISGVMNGMAAIGGLTIAVVFLSIQLEATIIRATLVALFFATDLYASIIAWSIGLIDAKLIYTAMALIPSLMIGVKIGSSLFNHSSSQSFRKATLGLLIVLSLTGFARVFMG